MTSTPTPRGPAFDALLETAATWVVAGTLAWGAALVLAALVERGSRGRLPALHWVGCPRGARPLLLAVAGLAVLVPGAAHAATGQADGPRPGDGSLPVPTRPVDDGAAPPPVAGAAPRAATALGTVRAAERAAVRAAARAADVTVRPGDSLWSLAQRRLGPAADDAAVTALVTRLHHRNRAVVGPDPDLLRPGQQLRFPATPPPLEAAP